MLSCAKKQLYEGAWRIFRTTGRTDGPLSLGTDEQFQVEVSGSDGVSAAM
jgi:hypothetical protein